MTHFDWCKGPLADGLRCYTNEEFFNAHEHWEGIWLKCNEPEKTFLQALIQTAAAFHHLQKGNFAGTQSLLRAALLRLGRYSSEFRGVAVEPLRDGIRLWIEALDRGLPPPPSYPRIR